MPKTTVRDPPRTNGCKPAHCLPSSKWVPGGNTEEIKTARKGTGHLNSQCWWPMTIVLSNTYSPKYGSYMGITLTLDWKNNLGNDVSLREILDKEGHIGCKLARLDVVLKRHKAMKESAAITILSCWDFTDFAISSLQMPLSFLSVGGRDSSEYYSVNSGKFISLIFALQIPLQWAEGLWYGIVLSLLSRRSLWCINGIYS